jgi:predicted dehydrogenase
VIRAAILGLGDVAEQIHLPACAMLPEVALVAACEPNPERRVRVGRRFGISTIYPDVETLLEREKPDVIIICTPPASHKNLCLAALERGANVLCEKPFVASVGEADEVIAAAERHRRSVFVNNQYRFMNIYRLSHERIASGEFGKPFLIQCWQQMFHPPSTETNWRARMVQYTLLEFGTHPLDLICFLFGALPLSIAAHTPHPCADIQADVVV